MKWIKKQEGLSIEHFLLLKDDTTALDLKFNHHTHTARVECDGRKRAFMIEDGGLFRNSILFRNEYGVEMGHLHFENSNGTEGYVQIENEKFSFAINNNSVPEINFYTNNSPVPAGSCVLPDKSTLSLSANGNSRKNPLMSAFLLLMGWYFYLPVLKANVVV